MITEQERSDSSKQAIIIQVSKIHSDSKTFSSFQRGHDRKSLGTVGLNKDALNCINPREETGSLQWHMYRKYMVLTNVFVYALRLFMILYVCLFVLYVLLRFSLCVPICLSVWASSASPLVCICHSSSVVRWLRLWFLSSQHSSKYSDKTQRTPRSLRPGQSIREKTTQRSGCFCSIKQPSEQQQPFSVWDVELILSRFLFLYFFHHPPSRSLYQKLSQIPRWEV